jgi:CBS domain-containing protein
MEKRLPGHALKPVVKLPVTVTVMDAVRAMAKMKVGAVVVLDGKQLKGIFTERDVATRVVLEQLDPTKTLVSGVMTTAVKTIRDDADPKVARRLMVENHIRHLPVLDASGEVISMLSMRHLLRAEVSELEQTVWTLVADSSADGPGG